MTNKLTSYDTLTFDCYGTLIDWESGIWDALQPLISANSRNDITREIGLRAFAKTESVQQQEFPGMIYSEILRNVHNSVAREFGLDTNAEMDQTFGQSVPHWPAFPDTADALRVLKKYFKLVILSNISNEGFSASNRKLGVEFDAVYTAEDIGSYKPDPRNFSYMLESLDSDLGIKTGNILHTAQSLYHDHAQAKAFDLANAWIDRQGLSKGDNWGATAQLDERPGFDFLFESMAEMANTVQREAL